MGRPDMGRDQLSFRGCVQQHPQQILTVQFENGTAVGIQAVSYTHLLAIARAIIHRPEVLILDEPADGLDPVGMKEMRILFRRLVQEEGMTILMSSHLLSEIEQIADRVGVIADGTIVQEAEMTNICKQHPSDMKDYFISLIQGGADHA